MKVENSINTLSLSDGIEIKKSETVLGMVFPFCEKGKIVSFQKNENESVPASSWGLSFKSAGGMLFSSEKENPNRNKFFESFLTKKIISVSLIHSKKVFFISNDEEIKNLKNKYYLGDGIVTDNSDYVPTITVADCVPIYLFNKKTLCRSVLHSGWKGTGIASVGIKTICEKTCSSANDILAAIGPHIGSCCYNVDDDRATFFRREFGDACVLENNHLSLLKANIEVLNRSGISNDRITILPECTCCNKLFGSFRREKILNKQDDFTRMVAFVL